MIATTELPCGTDELYTILKWARDGADPKHPHAPNAMLAAKLKACRLLDQPLQSSRVGNVHPTNWLLTDLGKYELHRLIAERQRNAEPLD